ncbi:flavin-containing monooxygenase [Pseudonocardia sp. TRM90224]|uniref:flavin-containing monooxygenase n=1 Tax=Pseudonocardia sp. TRM90224 TaxID=2812678 RepID=UPI001E472BD4|nr:NAD(P)/FAD-dependent oxidoreductase [Pseudonocardia sp. TRM90224]
MSENHVDVLIVGAGLSGVGAAVHLRRECPERSVAILEARGAMGGTWDLFRYPGIRSDSDMHTLGYRFTPWLAEDSIADGPSILDYVRRTARTYGVDKRIGYHRKVVSAAWSSAEQRWTVDVEHTDTGEREQLTCGFLYHCSGYYNYDQGFTPTFPGREKFAGQIVHPQHWPADFDYAGKRVVVIGSGATAVTLVPAMAADAGHVTMLQRSPTYFVSMPRQDPLDQLLRKFLPVKATYPIVRWKNVLIQAASYQLSRRRPAKMKEILRRGVERQLPAGYDVDTHFTPRYNPWDERLCLVPDGDFFEAVSNGSASIVTDEIDTFTEKGIRLRSGAELEADIIITATGLNLQLLGGAPVTVDGVEAKLADRLTYKGLMLEGVPNLAYTFGYTNASWTLRADLVAEYVCRLLNHMRAGGFAVAAPKNTDSAMPTKALFDFQPGYVRRALATLPRQGARRPWQVRMNYPLELFQLRRGPVTDGMRFEHPVSARPQIAQPESVTETDMAAEPARAAGS